MKDKSLGIWLIILFGASGLAVILLAWFWPTLQPERITATLAGMFGVAIATVRALLFRQSPINGDAEHTSAKVEVDDRS